MEAFFKNYQYTIGTVIDALSALFTLLAVIVSLWLAIRKPKEPDLVPIISIFKKAQKMGWFKDSLELFDFSTELSQAGVNGKAIFYGRKRNRIDFESLVIKRPLLKIPEGYWVEGKIQHNSILKNLQPNIVEIIDDNYLSVTFVLGGMSQNTDYYQDIHVTGIDKDWIIQAKRYKGRVRINYDEGRKRAKAMRDDPS